MGIHDYLNERLFYHSMGAKDFNEHVNLLYSLHVLHIVLCSQTTFSLLYLHVDKGLVTVLLAFVLYNAQILGSIDW